MGGAGMNIDPLLQMYQGVYGMPPAPYAPVAPAHFGGNPLLAMLATPYLSQAAGSNNFLPHLMPGQAPADQFMMRQYQMGTLQNTYNTNKMGTAHVANALLGMRSAFSETAATELNKEGANSLAGVLTNPYLKPMLGSLIGPENLEHMLYGRAGDPMAVAAFSNRMGYSRQDPAGGAKRMSGESLEDFSRGLYSQLYESGGNVDAMVERARAEVKTNPAGGASLKALRAASNTGDSVRVVEDEQVASRLQDLDDIKLDTLYDKYQQGGTATTKKEKAEALAKFDRAVNESNVLQRDETTFNTMQRRARDRNLDEMRGFSAGQTSRVAEDMFQRGELPQSLGALSPAERVKLISQHKFDDETMTRMAEEFGRRDLMKSDKKFASGDEFKKFSQLTEEEQQKVLREQVDQTGGYRDTMKKTFSQIQDYNNRGAASGFKSAEEVEKLAGASLMSNNVDASRVARVTKEKMGAVEAIREIFGDNGNPNAPVPALLAALEHLSQGSMSQMSPGKVENIIRQMRGTAKDMGMGFEQMAGFSAQMGAAGANLGLQKPTTLAATANAMTMINTMRQAGSFATPQFGRMSQEEATQAVGMNMLKGQKSENAMAIGALARVYALDPKKYAGTELEAVVKAAQDPSSNGNYEVKDASGAVVKRGNLYTSLGREGAQFAQDVGVRAGVSNRLLADLRMDSLTGEYVPDAVGFQSQRADVITQLSNRVLVGDLRSQAGKKDATNTMAANTKAGADQRFAVAEQLTTLMLDSANLETEKERVDFVTKNAEARFKEALVASGMKEPEAAKQAKFAYESYFGSDPAKQAERAQMLLSEVNSSAESRFGMNMPNLGLLYGEKAFGRFGSSMAESKNRADTEKRLGVGRNTTIAQRFSDYTAEIGKSGENFTLSGLSQALGGAIPIEELRRRFSDEMAGGVGAVQREREAMLVSEADIENASAAQLRTYAKLDANKQIVADSDIADKRKAAFSALGDDKLAELHKKHIKDSTATTRDARIAELMRYAESTDISGYADSDFAGKDGISQRDAIAEARRLRLGTLKDNTPENEKRYKQLGVIEKAVAESKTEADAKTGMTEFLRLVGVSESGAKAVDEFQKLVDSGVAGEDIQKTLKGKIGRDLTESEVKMLTGLQDAAKRKPGNAGFTADGSPLPADHKTKGQQQVEEFVGTHVKDDKEAKELAELGMKTDDASKAKFRAQFKEKTGKDLSEEDAKKIDAAHKQDAEERKPRPQVESGIEKVLTAATGEMTGAITDSITGTLTDGIVDAITTGFSAAMEEVVAMISDALSAAQDMFLEAKEGNAAKDSVPDAAADKKPDAVAGPAAADAAAASTSPDSQITPTPPYTAPPAPAGGSGPQEITITGTLDVPGFGEAILDARGPLILSAPNGGPPVYAQA